MSKDKISDYSTTANSNTDIGGINVDEGCAPSGINDAIRTLMAQLKNFQTGTGGDSFNGPFAGTTIAATDTTDASSTTAAAMKTAGGLAVAKKAYIGLDANIYGLTVGRGAGAVSTNTAVGASALAANTTGTFTTAVGYEAGKANTNGYSITAIGARAGWVVDGATNFTAVGTDSGRTSTTAASCSFVGANSGFSNTTGSYNSAVGDGALYSNSTASRNTSFGYQAGYANTTGTENLFAGYQSGNAVTTGVRNTILGSQSGQSLTTGSDNILIGYRTIYNASSTGSYNVALGNQALYSNTTAGGNTAIGYQAAYTNSTGASNVYLGQQAGYSTAGSSNVFVGSGAGYYVTSGAKNTIIGRYDGNQGGLDIRTASNYIVLSDGDGNPRGYYNNTGSFWAFNNGGAANSTVFNVYNDNASSPYGQFIQFSAASPNNTTYYFFRGQDSTTSCFTIWSNGTTSGRSDERLKKNIVDATPKLEDVCKLQVRNYEWKESINGHKEIGLIAQEVETVFPGLVVTHDLEKDGDDYKEVKYSALVPILIKAIQELKAEFDAYKEAHP